MAKKRSDFEFRRWGTEYKDGKLYNFSDKHVLVMSAWPDTRAWIKKRSHGWQCTRIWADKVFSSAIRTKCEADRESGPTVVPDGIDPEDIPEESETEKKRRLWFAKRMRKDRANIGKYMDHVPPETRRMVGAYGDRNWQVMNLFARCPGLEDMHRSNPALVLALANSWAFQKEPVKRPMRAARSLIFKKQKDILKWLGFPPTKHVRKILAKIPAESLELKGLLYLRYWLKDRRVLKYLSHLDRINDAVISMVTSKWHLPAVTPQLLTEVSGVTKQRKSNDIRGIFLDVTRMSNRLGQDRLPGSIKSLARLQAVHDQLSEDFNERFYGRDDLPDQFPYPPFTGSASILPITTPVELFQEGNEQKNCVASYAHRVVNGHQYIYKVYYPVRATLSVKMVGGCWIPGEIKESCNRDVPESLRDKLYQALFASGPFVPSVENGDADDEEDEVFDDLQLPLGMSLEALELVRKVESLFGRSQRIDIELPADRMSA